MNYIFKKNIFKSIYIQTKKVPKHIPKIYTNKVTHKIGLEIKCHFFVIKSQNKTEEKTPHGHVAKKTKHR